VVFFKASPLNNIFDNKSEIKLNYQLKLDVLIYIYFFYPFQRRALTATGRRAARLRVRAGSAAETWLRANVKAISSFVADPEDSNYVLVTAAVSPAEMGRFKKLFVDLKLDQQRKPL